MSDRPMRGYAPIARSDAGGTLKWFDPAKGFGFVTLDEDQQDAFLHVSTLQAFGHSTLPQGTRIVCDCSQAARGLQVALLKTVDTSTADPDMAPAPRPRRPEPRMGDDGEEGEGLVKFFNQRKGYGFIIPDGGGGDVFVHARALQRSGLVELVADQRVRYRLGPGTKGPQVVHVEIIG